MESLQLGHSKEDQVYSSVLLSVKAAQTCK